MSSNEQKIREIIQNYAHDFRDIRQTEKEMEIMIINMLYDLINETELYFHIIKAYKEKKSL